MVTEWRDARPSFKFTTEERALIVGSLQLAIASDDSEVLARLYNSFHQIDMAILTMEKMGTVPRD